MLGGFYRLPGQHRKNECTKIIMVEMNKGGGDMKSKKSSFVSQTDIRRGKTMQKKAA